jgi:hypothetical protein
MADSVPAIQFDDIPMEDARRMSRGPRMDPVTHGQGLLYIGGEFRRLT